MSGTGTHVAAGGAARGDYRVDIDPRRAGWSYSSLRVLELPPGGSHGFDTGESEWIVLPLAGGCRVTVDGVGFDLVGRDSVFEAVTDFVYAPRDARVELVSAGGGRFALTGARCARRLTARHVPASAVPIELRGAGSCSRQVNNFAAADVFEADRLIAVEVITPGGNWSSYPPHKHDEDRPPEETPLEEIYYFEIAASHGVEGLGFQRVTPSAPGRGSDLLAEVRDGDVVTIPAGWHGPSIAAPGHDMYYLNVMAGPGRERAWLISDHPEHGWVRASWSGQQVDPRLPFYRTPEGTG